MKKYKLDVPNDVDIDKSIFSTSVGYILNLPHGFRFDDEVVHVRGFDSMAELRQAAKNDVIPCDCKSCKEGLMNLRIKQRLGYK
jgi:hypothetical protein